MVNLKKEKKLTIALYFTIIKNEDGTIKELIPFGNDYRMVEKIKGVTVTKNDETE